MEGIVEVFDFFDCSLLMSELASFTIGAEGFLMELLALLGFIFIVNWVFLHNDLLVAVCELTLVPVSAKTLFDPVFAHFCFKLGLVYLAS